MHCGVSGTSHASPLQPGEQMHRPLAHAPCAPQSNSQPSSSHDAPRQLAQQRHVPSGAQSPWAVQSLGQARTEQSSDRQPASHTHTLFSPHTPWPEQSLAHLR